jgi:hypothetical protein
MVVGISLLLPLHLQDQQMYCKINTSVFSFLLGKYINSTVYILYSSAESFVKVCSLQQFPYKSLLNSLLLITAKEKVINPSVRGISAMPESIDTQILWINQNNIC